MADADYRLHVQLTDGARERCLLDCAAVDEEAVAAHIMADAEMVCSALKCSLDGGSLQCTSFAFSLNVSLSQIFLSMPPSFLLVSVYVYLSFRSLLRLETYVACH